MIYEKISPGLLLALQDFQSEGPQGLTRQTRSLALLPSVNTAKPARAIAFVYCDENADLEHLSQHDIQINQTTGRIRTAILPLESLNPLSEEPNVQRIKPSRYLKPLMDVAPGKVNLPDFLHASNSLSGQGTIIGIIDSGIDASHPAFAGRILQIWDQTLKGPGVPEGKYGLELSDLALIVSRDLDGHGTHVAGITAGKDATFNGIAPDAQLIIVKTDFQDAHIADGIRYVFRIATQLGLPAVVNLSLGGHFDAHDGSDSLSLIIDAESGPGRIVCCAAGNEGNDNIHGQTTLAPGQMHTMRFLVPTGITDVALLNGWYSGNSNLEVSIRTPGRFITPFQSIIISGDPTKSYSLPDAQIEITSPGSDPVNRDNNFFVQIRDPLRGSPVKGGIWQLRVHNRSAESSLLDVWSLDGQSTPQVIFTGTSIKDAVKIGSPGAAAQAITVASYTTKAQYIDINNTQRDIGLPLDSISDFSCEGPLRNGVQKPDVAAPGAMIVSALSADASYDQSQKINDKFVVLAGTSMAAPFITGVIALLLQRNPLLKPEEAKNLLCVNSSIPGQPAGAFDPKWGFGLLDTRSL